MIISVGAYGGPSSWVCAHLILRSAPRRRQRKFFGAHVWEGVTNLKAFLINFLAISGDSKLFHFFE